MLGGIRRVGPDPPEGDLVAVEEVPQLRAGRVPAMSDHDRPGRRRLGRDGLKAARSADPVGGQPAHLPPDVGRHGRDRVVVVGLDPHDARPLRRAEANREHRAERNRHLSEDVAHEPLAHDPLDAVHELHRLDAALEQGEQRALLALVRGVLPGHEADVGRRPGQALAIRGAQAGEDRDPADLFGRHHAPKLLRCARHAWGARITRAPWPATGSRRSRYATRVSSSHPLASLAAHAAHEARRDDH